MFRSIRWRIAAAFAIVVVLCILGLSLYLANFVRNEHIDNLKVQLADQAWIVADSSAPYFVSDQTAELNGLAVRLGDLISGRVTIVAGDGIVLGDSQEDPAGMENHSDRPEVAQALTGTVGTSIRHSETLGRDMMYVAVPIEAGSTIVGAARVSLPLTAINQTIGHINKAIALAAVIAAVLGIVAALQLTRVTVNPIKKLTQASRKMAEGDLGQEIRVTSSDEVGDLARAFNRMSCRVKETMSLVTTERDKMAVILAHMGDAILAVDGEGRVTTVNSAAERILQLSRENAVGRTFIKVVRDYELDAMLQSCLKSGEEQTALVEIGARRQSLGVIVTPFKGEPGCLMLIQDLTEMRKLETAKRDFVANLSHELRTPIASLKALTETLQAGAIDDPTVADDFLGRMNAEADRLAQMAEELGELSRIEGGQVSLNKEPVDLPDLVAGVLDRLRAQAERAGLLLETRIDPGLPHVPADRGRLEQVLVNLVHNAIKFTAPGGRVSVTARADGQHLTVSVSDTGVGISADDLPRVFERFYKADRARAGGGTGLGLAIAKHIVEAHQGRIWAESVEGKGSTFSFRLPLAS
jgi:two-component system phosphate regulon sensor histidine kinase PhoR